MIATWMFVIAVILGLSSLAIVGRIIVGPTIIDRVLASDVLVVVLVCALALESARSRSTTLLPAMVVLVLVGFIGTVAVSRFVTRESATKEPTSLPMAKSNPGAGEER